MTTQEGDATLDRRRFLLACALSGGLAGLARPARARRLERVGLQLYTVRAELARDVEGTVARVAEIGFSEVELAGHAGRTPAELAAILARHDLTAPSGHTQLAGLAEDRLEAELDACAALGHRYLVCAYLAPNQRRTLDQYRAHADLFNRSGERCRSAGVRLAYHNHDFELAPIAGPNGATMPLELLLERCDPQLVAFELDLYWITKGGGDPLSYFARWPGRFELFHVKDMDASEAGSFTEVGAGVIDFERIFAHAGQAGVRHSFVEQDVVQGDLWQSLRTSYAAARALRAG
ncbi:MAG TPA: sugar phosphate isomerase/epimerase [Thermoanaerobaculia bacterium]|nr:sugar phosphate isomerase/epimerase [Thermoanaerobaculia bacterium]